MSYLFRRLKIRAGKVPALIKNNADCYQVYGFGLYVDYKIKDVVFYNFPLKIQRFLNKNGS